MTKTRSGKKTVSPDVPGSAGTNKKQAKSKTPCSKRKKGGGGGGGRNGKRMKNAASAATQSGEATNMSNKYKDEDDTIKTISQPVIDSEIPIVGRQNIFSESLWWMVDLEYDPVAESKSPGGTSCPASSTSTSTSSANRQGATPLVKRCMRMYGWDFPTTRKILKGYRQFLHLKKHFEDWDATILSPSEQIDKMWHAHILDVNNYVHDCILLCGHVVGHNPDGMVDTAAKAARVKSTKEALIEQFGPENFDETVWLTRQELEEKEHEYHDLTYDQNPDRPVTITLRDYENGRVRETLFKVKTTTKMSKIFDAFCRLKGVERRQLRFLFDGEWIDPDVTPYNLQLEDGDQIDVLLEQIGC